MPPARPRLVIKYGGTTISSASRVRSVSEYLATMSQRYDLVVVCSAVGNTTDDLVRISELMRAGDREGVSELVRKVAGLHRNMSPRAGGRPHPSGGAAGVAGWPPSGSCSR